MYPSFNWKRIISDIWLTPRQLVFILRYKRIIHNAVTGASSICDLPACSNKVPFLQRMLIAVRFTRFVIISNLPQSLLIRRSFFMSFSILQHPYHSHEVQLKYEIFHSDMTKSISHTITFKNDIRPTTFKKKKHPHDCRPWFPAPPSNISFRDKRLGTFFWPWLSIMYSQLLLLINYASGWWNKAGSRLCGMSGRAIRILTFSLCRAVPCKWRS